MDNSTVQKLLRVDWGGFLRGVYEYNVLRHLKTLPPRQAQINVTYRCNARCQMCNIWQWERREEMTLQQFVEVMADPVFDGLERIIIGGGEPILRQDLVELVEFFLERMPRLLSMTFLTNGLLPERAATVAEAIAQRCQQRGVRLTASVSMDAVGELNDRVRGVPGAFSRAAETIDLLKPLAARYDFSLGVAAVVFNETLPHVAELRQWCRERGVHVGFQIVGFHESYVSNLEKKDDLDFTSQDREALFALMEELAERRSLTNFPAFYWNDMLHLYRDGRPRHTPCVLAVDTFALDAYGDIYYCPSELKIGNCLTDGTISEIYYDPRNLARRAEMVRTICPTCNSGCFLNTGLKKDAGKYIRFLLTGRS